MIPFPSKAHFIHFMQASENFSLFRRAHSGLPHIAVFLQIKLDILCMTRSLN